MKHESFILFACRIIGGLGFDYLSGRMAGGNGSDGRGNEMWIWYLTGVLVFNVNCFNIFLIAFVV